MGRFVIVTYTPKDGMEQQLLAVVKKHIEILRAQQLVTDRPAYIMRAADGSIVEVFEWRSVESIEAAHSNPAVQGLWDEFDAVCAYTPLANLAEASKLFAEFDSIES
jgi:quinol monooxygenase YgiN